MHSQYNRRNIDNDIALLKLSRPVSLTRNGGVVPACLPASNSNSFAGVQATVAGWGATAEGYPTSSKLRKVDVPVISNNDCRSKSSYGSKITDNMLCAGYLDQGGRDSCQVAILTYSICFHVHVALVMAWNFRVTPVAHLLLTMAGGRRSLVSFLGAMAVLNPRHQVSILVFPVSIMFTHGQFYFRKLNVPLIIDFIFSRSRLSRVDFSKHT